MVGLKIENIGDNWRVRMSSVLVSGGAGFIGSHLTETLVKDGKKVKVFDNFSTGNRDNLSHIQGDFEIIEGDLRSLEDCMEAAKGVDVIFHQGAIPAVPRSVFDPLLTHNSNINGSLNILLAARDRNVKRVVTAGSSAIYGNAETFPVTENYVPDPISPYALHKLTTDYYCRLFHQLYGLETVSLRYFNVFGPRQDPNSDYSAVIPIFISKMLKGEQPTIYGDGKQTRDFTYVMDVVQGNVLAATAPDAPGKVMNLAIGERFDLLTLVAHINSVLGTNISPKFEAPRPGDVKDSQADISLARKTLNFKPGFSFLEGLRKTIEWFK